MVAKIIIEMVKIEENHKSENGKLCTDLTLSKLNFFCWKFLYLQKTNKDYKKGLKNGILEVKEM